MFKNIGSKIQTLAEIICAFGIVGSIFAGIALGAESESFFIFLVIGGLGALASWIGSFFLYGFGQLITSTEQIAENTNLIIYQNRAIQINQKTLIKNQSPTSESNTEEGKIETETPESL